MGVEPLREQRSACSACGIGSASGNIADVKSRFMTVRFALQPAKGSSSCLNPIDLSLALSHQASRSLLVDVRGAIDSRPQQSLKAAYDGSLRIALSLMHRRVSKHMLPICHAELAPTAGTSQMRRGHDQPTSHQSPNGVLRECSGSK